MIPIGLYCFQRFQNIYSDIYLRVLSSTRPYQALTIKDKNKQNGLSDKTFTFLQRISSLFPFQKFRLIMTNENEWTIGHMCQSYMSILMRTLRTIAVVRSEPYSVQVTVSYTMVECRSSHIHDLNFSPCLMNLRYWTFDIGCWTFDI